MLPILITPDFKEAAKRERFKQIEAERRERIFNAKKRQIGIDFEALQQQIEENKVRKAQEKAEEMKYFLKQKNDTFVLNEIQHKVDIQRRKGQQKLDEYRRLFQKFEDRREFDLNNPNRLKQERPDPDPDDPRFGISSMKRFEGSEDENSELRRKIQQEQQQTWLLQQMMEKEKEKRDLKVAESIYLETVQARASRYMSLKDMEAECKKKLQVSVNEYNKAMAVEKVKKQLEEMKMDLEDSYTHNMNQITSDFLCENKDDSSILGPGRKVTSMYKGMSNEQLLEIKRVQQLQIAEKEARKREEEMEEKYYQSYHGKLQQMIANSDTIQKTKQSELVGDLRMENRKLMEEQKAKKRYLDKVVYTNSLSPDYYNQFNTSTR